MVKKLCKVKKSLRKNDFAAYCKLVSNPKHVCRLCGRVANKKKLVCEPKKL